VILIILSTFSVGGETIAEAQGTRNARLNGEYAFTQSRNCVDTTEGFGPNFQLNPLPPPGTPGVHFIRRAVNSDRGIVQFNGDGTGTATVFTTQINLAPVTFPVAESEATCNLTYSVSPDGTVSLQAACTGTTVAGGGAGNTFTITGVDVRRQIVQGNTALLHSPAHPPAVETITVTPPGAGAPFTFARVCTRSGITSKVSPR